MAINVKPLSDALGAEICGLDLSQELDSATVARVKTEWHQHLVLLFREQKLTEDEQIRFARYFGALQQRPRPKEMRGNAESDLKYPEATTLISNIRKNGELIGSLPDGELHFHTDGCFREKPPSGTFLYAIEVPREGGDTVFSNMYAAWASLPEHIKAQIENKKALNIYLYGNGSQQNYTPDFSTDLKFVHPMVRTHPDTGRDVLFVNRLMTWTIEGMSQTESRQLLDTLFDHLEQPQFVYAHKWRPGDLLLWDNRCTQHARTDFSAQERRLLRRVVVQGDRPFRRTAAADALAADDNRPVEARAEGY